MRTLSVARPLLLAIIVLLAAQLACSASAATPTAVPPTPAPPVSQATQPPAATSSGQYATPAEAQAMLQAAVQHYQQVGRDQALADFTAGKAPFIDRDLYVACIDSGHNLIANGGFPALVGQSADLIKDVNGNPVGKQIWDAASQQSTGSVSYRWINPLTSNTEAKLFFYQKLDQDVCGVGAYSP